MTDTNLGTVSLSAGAIERISARARTAGIVPTAVALGVGAATLSKALRSGRIRRGTAAQLERAYLTEGDAPGGPGPVSAGVAEAEPVDLESVLDGLLRIRREVDRFVESTRVSIERARQQTRTAA